MGDERPVSEFDLVWKFESDKCSAAGRIGGKLDFNKWNWCHIYNTLIPILISSILLMPHREPSKKKHVQEHEL